MKIFEASGRLPPWSAPSRASTGPPAQGPNPAGDRVDLNATGSAVPPTPGPAPQVPASTLDLLRKEFPPDFGGVRIRQNEDRCPVIGKDLHYWYDHEDGKHGFHYQPAGQERLLHGYYIARDRFDLTGQISLSPDGRQVLGQTRNQDGTYALLDLPLRRGLAGRFLGVFERWGWLPGRVVMNFPEKAAAFDLGPGGKLAVALGGTVHLRDGQGRLQPWKSFQDPIQDVEYLEDGTLAVVTKAPAQALPSFHLQPPGGADPVTLSMREVHPADYSRSVEQRCASLAFLKDASFEQKERFLGRCEWLGASGGWGWQPHRELGRNPQGAVRLALLESGKAPTLWDYDPSTGQAARVATLSVPAQTLLPTGQDGKGWEGLKVSPDGGWLALVPPAGQPLSLPIWKAATGELAVILPLVGDLSFQDDAVHFVDPLGEPRQVPPERLHSVKQEAWYRSATSALLLGSRQVEAPRQGLRVEGRHLRVGGSLLRLRDNREVGG